MYIFKLYLEKIKCKFSFMFLYAYASIFSAKIVLTAVSLIPCKNLKVSDDHSLRTQLPIVIQLK